MTSVILALAYLLTPLTAQAAEPFAGNEVARAQEAKRSDILIADFEADTYGDWKVEGEAFGSGPAEGTLPGQMHVSGFQGKPRFFRSSMRTTRRALAKTRCSSLSRAPAAASAWLTAKTAA